MLIWIVTSATFDYRPMQQCPQCGSRNVEHTILDFEYGLIPRDTPRFDWCKRCLYWQESVATRDTTINSTDWAVTRTGDGEYGANQYWEDTDVSG